VPTWLDSDLGPVYTDENGDPAVPPPESFDALLGSPVPGDQFHGDLPGSNPLSTPAPGPSAGEPEDIQPGDPGAGLAPPPAPVVSAGQRTSGGFGLSAGSRAFDPGVYQTIPFGDLAASNRAAAERSAQEGQDWAGILQNAYGDAAQAKAEETSVLARQADARAAGYDTMAALQGRFAAAEAAAQTSARLAATRALARYDGATRQYAAMSVDPNQLWGRATGFERGVLAVGAFVTDFLGARGIHTSAMDSFNAAVDRNIQAQIANMQHAGDVAGHFGQLWQAQLAESGSEAEARDRMRGFYLAQAQNAVQAEIMRYDSPLAQAQGHEALAALDQELARNLVGIGQQTEQNYLAAAKINADVWQTGLQASIAQRDLAIRQQEADAQSADVSGKAVDAYLKDVDPRIVRDPLTGDPVRVAGTPEIADDLNKKSAAAQTVLRQIKDYRDMEERFGKQYQGPGKHQLDSTDAAELDSRRQQILQTMIHANDGKRITDSEVKRWTEILGGDNGLTTRADVAKVLDDFAERLYAQFNDESTSRGRKLNYREKALVQQGLITGGEPMNVGQAYNVDAGVDQRGPQPDTAVGQAFRASQAPDSSRTLDLEDYRQWVTQDDKNAMQQLGVGGARTDADGKVIFGAPEWSRDYLMAADAATSAADQAAGTPVAKDQDDAERRLAEEAITKLSVIASGYDARDVAEAMQNVTSEPTPPTDPSDPSDIAVRRAWAQHLLLEKVLPAYEARWGNPMNASGGYTTDSALGDMSAPPPTTDATTSASPVSEPH
jgi:hypothetical protein